MWQSLRFRHLDNVSTDGLRMYQKKNLARIYGLTNLENTHFYSLDSDRNLFYVVKVSPSLPLSSHTFLSLSLFSHVRRVEKWWEPERERERLLHFLSILPRGRKEVIFSFFPRKNYFCNTSNGRTGTFFLTENQNFSLSFLPFLSFSPSWRKKRREKTKKKNWMEINIVIVCCIEYQFDTIKVLELDLRTLELIRKWTKDGESWCFYSTELII